MPVTAFAYRYEQMLKTDPFFCHLVCRQAEPRNHRDPYDPFKGEQGDQGEQILEEVLLRPREGFKAIGGPGKTFVS